MYLPSYVKTALRILKCNGYEAFVVGGCVRDALRGMTPFDYDIAVSSTPSETKACFSEYRIIDTGIKHGTVTVVIDGKNLELTTFRCEGEYHNYRSPEEVFFTHDIKEDIGRRDFTMNAVCYSEEFGFLDIVGGIDDINSKIIRCVGEPDRRFSEDALRIMRAVRFSSVLGFKIEEKTAVSIHKNKELLLNISAERIFSELKKLLCGKNVKSVIKEFRDVFEIVFPEISPLSDDEISFVAELIEQCASLPVKFSLLFMYSPRDDAEKALQRLKTDNSLKNSVCFILDNKDKSFVNSGEIKRLCGAYGIKRTYELAYYKKLVSSKDSELFFSVLSEIKKRKQCLEIKDLAINGEDLMKMGFSGKEIGKALQYALELVTDGKIQNSRCEIEKALLKEFN